MESRKSSTGSTTPRPIRWNQTRLTRLLAKNGLDGPVSQLASFRRRSTRLLVLGSGEPASSKVGPPRALGFIVLPVRGWRTSPELVRVDHLILGQGPGLPLDPREEGGEAVIVVLGPALERVVVALGALDPDAEEELGRGLGRVLRVAADPVVVRGRVPERRAVGGEQLADELVERGVPLQVGPDPAVEGVRPLGLDQPAVGPEDVGELQSPEVGELRATQQAVDQPRPTVGAGVGQERLDLLGRGEDPHGVERGPAEELGVGANLGRADPHPVQLGEDRAVDRVVRGDFREPEPGDLDQVRQADVGDEVEVVGDDRDLAPVLEADEAVGIDVGDLGVGRVVVADRGHVAGRPVGIVGHDRATC